METIIKNSDVILLVDGYKTTLEEFLKTNCEDPDVDPPCSEDLEAVQSLEVGQSVHVCFVEIKRIK
jgi:hypothetical protein